MAEGVPLPGEDKLSSEQRRRLNTPPNWAALMSELERAAEIHKSDEQGTERLSAIVALRGVVDFLEACPEIGAQRLHIPLANLCSALLDLECGSKPSILQPLKGKKLSATPQKTMKATAAFAVTMLMKDQHCRKTEVEACGLVARVLQQQGWQRTGGRAIDALTVQNWRKSVIGGSPSEDEATNLYRFLLTRADDHLTQLSGADLANRHLDWLAERFPQDARKS